ncbi:MAG: hypothetical protein ICV64_12315 [Thermoleophilia bacterium]|nr:hypothetical protein [Thermoleophilia bacterium]
MPTAERIGKNEALFREVNQRIRELNEAFETSGAGELTDFVCECSLEGCREYVRLTLAEYEEVRTSAARFLVAPGHQWTPESEREVGRHERYWVVEKLGAAREVAEREADAP